MLRACLVVILLILTLGCEESPVVLDKEKLKEIPAREKVRVIVDNGFAQELEIRVNDNKVVAVPAMDHKEFHLTVGEVKLSSLVKGQEVHVKNVSIRKVEDKGIQRTFVYNPAARHNYETIIGTYRFVVGGGISYGEQLLGQDWVEQNFNYYLSESLPGAIQGEGRRTKLARIVTEKSDPVIAMHALQNIGSSLYQQRTLKVAAAVVAAAEDKEQACSILLQLFDQKDIREDVVTTAAASLLKIGNKEILPDIQKHYENPDLGRSKREALAMVLAGMKAYDKLLVSIEAKKVNLYIIIAALKKLPDTERRNSLLTLLPKVPEKQRKPLAEAFFSRDFEDSNFAAKITAVTVSLKDAGLTSDIIDKLRRNFSTFTLDDQESIEKFILESDSIVDEHWLALHFLKNQRFDDLQKALPQMGAHAIDRLYRSIKEKPYSQTDIAKKLVLWTLASPHPEVQKRVKDRLIFNKEWVKDPDFTKAVREAAKSSKNESHSKTLMDWLNGNKLQAMKNFADNRQELEGLLPSSYPDAIHRFVTLMTASGENQEQNLKFLLKKFTDIEREDTRIAVVNAVSRFNKMNSLKYQFWNRALKDPGSEVVLAAMKEFTRVLRHAPREEQSSKNSALKQRVKDEKDKELKEKMMALYSEWRLRFLESGRKRSKSAGAEALYFLQKYAYNEKLVKLAASAVAECSTEEQVVSVAKVIVNMNIDAHTEFRSYLSSIKNPKYYMTLFNALIKSPTPSVRVDTFHDLFLRVARKEVEASKAKPILIDTIRQEKHPESKKRMLEYYERRRLKDVGRTLGKDPQAEDRIIKIMLSNGTIESVVDDAVSLLSRSKTNKLPGILTKNMASFSEDSLKKILFRLSFKIREGQKDYLALYFKALKSKSVKIRVEAFEKLCYSVHQKNELNSIIEKTAKAAYVAEKDESARRKMAYQIKRLKW